MLNLNSPVGRKQERRRKGKRRRGGGGGEGAKGLTISAYITGGGEAGRGWGSWPCTGNLLLYTRPEIRMYHSHARIRVQRGNTYARPVGGLIRTRADRERRWEARHLYTTKLDLRAVHLRLSYPRGPLSSPPSLSIDIRAFSRQYFAIFFLFFIPPPSSCDPRSFN